MEREGGEVNDVTRTVKRTVLQLCLIFTSLAFPLLFFFFS